MIIAGIHTIGKLNDKHSAEIEAECIGIEVKDVCIGNEPGDRTRYKDTRRPIYRYHYKGKEYTSSPMIASNRPGYKVEKGYCKIRINPKHPETVYSPERRMVGIILICIGAVWKLISVAAVLVIGYIAYK